MSRPDPSPRQRALQALLEIQQRGAYADMALERVLQGATLAGPDRSLVTELVYGSTRRQRSLDALLDHLGKQPAQQQPPLLRAILHLGLYQLRYLERVPAAAAVHTSVNLAKQNRLGKLAGVVNGILRRYLREAATGDPLPLPAGAIARLGVEHSLPDWVVALWAEQFDLATAADLAAWFNQPPSLDLRVNPLKTSVAAVQAALAERQLEAAPVPPLPQALRLRGATGAIHQLPGFGAGHWTVQDSGAQLAAYLLAPQPGEVVIDACAAPGGKATQIAELMGDVGTVWANDRHPQRLTKVGEAAARLGLRSLQLCPGDARALPQFVNQAERVLLDAPCSGLGTLHRHPDLRWRQTPATVAELTQLQRELLAATATWVKPGGILVYVTCTLNAAENEKIVTAFLGDHPEWQLQPPPPEFPWASLASKAGWLQLLPSVHSCDGFFMARLQRQGG